MGFLNKGTSGSLCLYLLIVVFLDSFPSLHLFRRILIYFFLFNNILCFVLSLRSFFIIKDRKSMHLIRWEQRKYLGVEIINNIYSMKKQLFSIKEKNNFYKKERKYSTYLPSTHPSSIFS